MRFPEFRRLGRALCGVASLLLPLSAFSSPPPGVLDLSHASVRAVIAVQNQVSSDWMRDRTVLGTAVGIATSGMPALTVYIDRDAINAGEVIRNLPKELSGIG